MTLHAARRISLSGVLLTSAYAAPIPLIGLEYEYNLEAMRVQSNRIEADIAALKERDHTREAYLSALHSDTARQSGRLDEHDARPKRIERRLELVDEQPQ